MRWNFGEILFLALAAGYLALGLYGKYRRLKEAWLEERDKRLRIASGLPPENDT